MKHGLPKIVGLTGGIGSGKSVVRQMFEEFGIPGIDGDVVARSIHQNPDHPAVGDIARAFPEAIGADGALSRGSLRRLFSIDMAANERVKNILQPHVVAQMMAWTAKQTALYVIWESALIIEAKIAVDRILVVASGRDLQFERVRARNPEWSDNEISAVMALQLDGNERQMRAHDVIRNDASLDVVRDQVRHLHQNYINLWTPI